MKIYKVCHNSNIQTEWYWFLMKCNDKILNNSMKTGSQVNNMHLRKETSNPAGLFFLSVFNQMK